MWTDQVITVKNSFMDLNAFSVHSTVKKKDFPKQVTVDCTHTLECITTEQNSKGMQQITFCGNYIICKQKVYF